MVLARALPSLRTLRTPHTVLRGVRGISTPTPIAPPRKLAFAFDIDGVLKSGKNVMPFAKRIVKFLSGADGRLTEPVPFLLMTNGGGVPDVRRRALLSADLDVPLTENQLVQSHTPLAPIMAEYADTPVLVVGGKADAARKVAESYGLRKAVIPQDILHWNRAIWDRYDFTDADERIVRHDIDFTTTPLRAIFVLHDSVDWGRDLTIINELMQSEGGLLATIRQDRHVQKPGGELPLYFSNPDLEWASDYPIVRLGMGAFSLSVASVYKAVTGLDLPYTQIGKPHHLTYEFADSMLRRRAFELRGAEEDLHVYMIGDNPLSDIWGANDYGWNSILVRTGVYRGGEPAHTPTLIADDVAVAVEWAFKREMGLEQGDKS